MSVRIEGSKQFREAVDRVALEGDERNVNLSDLFPDRFVQSHTEFGNIEEFFRGSPKEIRDDTNIGEMSTPEFDEYVAAHTGFDSWESMLSAGVREWVLRQDRA